MRLNDDIIMGLINEAVEHYFDTHANKNSIDAVKIDGMCNELQEIHDSMIRNGDSPHEVTAMSLQQAIDELRKVVKMMS